MDKAARRDLFSSVDASGRPKWEPVRLSDFSNSVAGNLDGVRNLDASAQDSPVDMQSEHGEDRLEIKPTVDLIEGVRTRLNGVVLATYLGIFLLALLPRLYFLFFVSGPQNAGAGWYGDTYHHWQIAYFTKEIGISQGFKLWDLKGMEYFWGPAHPLLLSGLFALTGSTDIVITRLLSIVFGSIACIFVFLLGRRYWNQQVGIAAMLFAALNPVSIFNDASGMVEPVAIPFLLAGLYSWPRRPWLAGLMWAVAGMLRAEYWLFGAGLIVVVLLTKREKSDQKLGLALGWGLPILVYMKFLLDRTGNVIYPIYWSFLGNAVGKWQADVPLGPEQTIGRNAFLVVLILALAGIFLTLRKKPRSYILNLLGFGNLLFLGVFVGLTAYSLSYRHYFWVVRIFELPYLVLALLLSAALLWRNHATPSNTLRTLAGWTTLSLVIVASQLAWLPIWDYFTPTRLTWDQEVAKASEIASTYDGGTLLIPEGDPNLTYALVQFEGLTAETLLGQKYDPFAYFQSDPFVDWQDSRDVIVDWLAGEDIRLIAFHTGKETYEEMVKREPGIFEFVGLASNGSLQIYKVNNQ